jgi:transcriptional regulatory protein LevR
MSEPAATAFDERLSLLVGSGQVTPVARRLTESVVVEVETALGRALGEDDGAPFVTHLAMALSRLDRGEEAPAPSVAVEEELRAHPREHELMERALGRCGDELGRPVPATEVAYMTMHLCALTEG